MRSISKEEPTGSKGTSRRKLLTDLAGGVTVGAVAGGALASRFALPAFGQTPAPGPAPAHAHSIADSSPMIQGNKEMIAYGERSHYVTSVRIAHPMNGRPSPDLFGKVF